MLVYLVGNKYDLEDEREVTKDEGAILVRELKFSGHYETSALSGKSVNELFENITKHLYLINKNKLDDFVLLFIR